MSKNLDSALWCPKPVRRFFVGREVWARCSVPHEPRIFLINGGAWVVFCPRFGLECEGGARSVGSLFYVGSEADLPPAARKLAIGDANPIARVFSAGKPLPEGVHPIELVPSGDFGIAQALGVTSWSWFEDKGALAALGMRGDQPVAIIACVSSRVKKLRNKLKKAGKEG